MSWAWLTSPPLLLVGLIASTITVVQFLSPAVRKIIVRRAEAQASKASAKLPPGGYIYSDRFWAQMNQYFESVPTGPFTRAINRLAERR
jgi:hypothetical protein